MPSSSAGAGGALTDIGQWYRDLKKPRWQPPDWLFGPAWTTILGLAGWSFYIGLTEAPTPEAATGNISPCSAQIFVLHFLWSPLFFRLKRPDWALAENVLLWCFGRRTADGAAAPGGQQLRQGWLNVPYFIWVSFAFILNWKIVKLNAPFGEASAAS